MATRTRHDKIVVGVDGSDASVEALRQAHRLASALGTSVEGLICWDFPAGHEAYEMMGQDGFSHQASEILQVAMTKAFGPELPGNVRTRLVLGAARQSLIDVSRFASLLVVGRRGHGGFNGLLLGSVSAACVAHAHCPVLVVHAPEANGHAEPRPGTTGAALVLDGFAGPIYATHGTGELSKLLLPDGGHFQEKEARYAIHRGSSAHVPALPVYTAGDAVRSLNLFEPRDFDAPLDLGDGVDATFLQAGHILGAAQIHLNVDGHQPERRAHDHHFRQRHAHRRKDPSPSGSLWSGP